MNPANLKIPWGTAINLARDFAKQNHELYLVGGAVRDILLGEPQNVSDLDFTTDADMDTIDDILLAKDSRTFRICSKIPVQRAHINRFCVDVSQHHTFLDDGTVASDSVDLETDLKARDFTINAMALRMSDNKLIDIFGGVEDMKNSVIRTPMEPKQTFRNDPVRILRAVRFAAQMRYSIEKETLAAIRQTSHLLGEHDVGRAMAELWKILEEEYTDKTCEWLAETNAGNIMFGNGFNEHHKTISARIANKRRWRVIESKASEMWWNGQTDYGVFGDWYEGVTRIGFLHIQPKVFKESDQYRKDKSEEFKAYDGLSQTLVLAN